MGPRAMLLPAKVNYYTDIIADRVYLQRVSPTADWERISREENPVLLEKSPKGKWVMLPNKGEEAKGEEVSSGKLMLYLNALYGQINNFLIFRNRGFETQGERHYNVPLRDLGNYAEDVLRSAALFWKEGQKNRFLEAFTFGILEGGYSNIEQLNARFVEDAELKRCESVLRKHIQEMIDKGPVKKTDHAGADLKDRKQRLSYILDQTFSKEKTQPDH